MSAQSSQYINSLTVNEIYIRGSSNINIPAFRVLASDGNGGTFWTALSSLKDGGAFHTINTSVASYNATGNQSVFSLLDGPNVGLLNEPTASNTAYLYAKAFGQFDVSGSDTLYAYDAVNNRLTSNVTFVGLGGIDVIGDAENNIMYFNGPYISTIPYALNSTLASYVNGVNSTINVNLSTFSAASLYLGDTGNANSTVSTLFIGFSRLSSTLSKSLSSFKSGWNPPGQTYTSTLFTSSIFYGGTRQPFIQYGNSPMTIDTPTILNVPYTNTNYSIQLTYSNNTQPTRPLFTSNVTSNQFYVTGDPGTRFYWNTCGDIF